MVALLFCFASISAPIRAWEVSYKVQGISWLEVLVVWAMVQGAGIAGVAALWITAWYGRGNDPLYLLHDSSRGNPSREKSWIGQGDALAKVVWEAGIISC